MNQFRHGLGKLPSPQWRELPVYNVGGPMTAPSTAVSSNGLPKPANRPPGSATQRTLPASALNTTKLSRRLTKIQPGSLTSHGLMRRGHSGEHTKCAHAWENMHGYSPTCALSEPSKCIRNTVSFSQRGCPAVYLNSLGAVVK